MSTETHLKILKYIESNPKLSQRQLAQKLGLGKVNCRSNSVIYSRLWGNGGYLTYKECPKNMIFLLNRTDIYG